jgi:hypothetical protein
VSAIEDYEEQSVSSRAIERRLKHVSASRDDLLAFLVEDYTTEVDFLDTAKRSLSLPNYQERLKVYDMVRDWILRMAFVKHQFDLAENGDVEARDWLIHKRYLGVVEDEAY